MCDQLHSDRPAGRGSGARGRGLIDPCPGDPNRRRGHRRPARAARPHARPRRHDAVAAAEPRRPRPRHDRAAARRLRRRRRLGAHGQPARRRGPHPGPRPARRPARRAAGDPRHPRRRRRRHPAGDRHDVAAAAAGRPDPAGRLLRAVPAVDQRAPPGAARGAAERGDVASSAARWPSAASSAWSPPVCSSATAATTAGRSGSGSASPCSRWPWPAACCRTARRPPPAGSTGGAPLVLGAGLVLLLLPVSQGNVVGLGVARRSSAASPASAVVLTGWVVLQRRTAEPLVRPAMLADRRTIVPNVAGLMTGIALFASFLAVLQYVQAPAGGHRVRLRRLGARGVGDLPAARRDRRDRCVAPVAGRVVTRFGRAAHAAGRRRRRGVAGFLLLAFLPRRAVVGRRSRACSPSCR